MIEIVTLYLNGDIFGSKTFNDNDTLEEASSDNLSLARALAYDER